MTQVKTFAEAKEQLRRAIASGEAALVIGAGASVESGGPTGQELSTCLRAKFPVAHLGADAKFLDIGSAICDSPEFGRLKLVKFICDQLRDLTPAEAYTQIPRLRWRALFTTNYDDLIEQAYRTPSRVQTLAVLHAGDNLGIPREETLYLFYLMGSIKEAHDSYRSPAVSWADFLDYVQRRKAILDGIYSILVDGGQLIYLGYSFNDFLLDSVLDEVQRKLGQRNSSYGFAILSGWPEDREYAIHKLESRKVIPIDGTFEDFAVLISEVAAEEEAAAKGRRDGKQAEKRASPAAGKTLVIGGEPIVLSESEWGVYSEAFELVDEDLSRLPAISASETRERAEKFLKGEFLGWEPFSRGWAFKRDAYPRVLRSAESMAAHQSSRENGVLLIHGPAGLGKTVMARQLAFDLASAGYPTLLARPNWRARPDLKLLDRFIDDIEDKLPEGKHTPPLFVIIDGAELLDRVTPSRICSYLRSKGRSVRVILFGRTNEYFRAFDSNVSDKGALADVQDIRLDEMIGEKELESLVQHLSAIGIWGDRISDPTFWKEHVHTELHDSFFDTLYSLIEPTQQPLRERIASEFDGLSPHAREAYLLIASTHQFGIHLKMEVLMRALGLPFSQFEAEVIRSDARDVLFSEYEGSDLNLFFRGRTPLISQLVFERAVPERVSQLQIFLRVVEAINPSDMFGREELDALRILLVNVLGPSGYDRRFSPDELAELFEKATQTIQDDVLEHHYGLVERQAARLPSSRRHLERALELSELLPDDLARPRETRQNIENSLALVIGDMALDMAKRNLAAAEALFEDARTHFLNARSGLFPNPAAYDALARLLWQRANRLYKPGTTGRAVALAEALEVISEGLDNVNADSRPGLAELRTRIFEELGLDTDALSALEKEAAEASKQTRARYLVLIARVLLHRRKADLKRKTARQALHYVVDATECDPDYFPAWKIRAELYAFLEPDDKTALLEILSNAERCAGGAENHWVLYEYAITAFLLERYELSAKTFARLRRVSRGHDNNNGVIEHAGDRTGEQSEPEEWFGYVSRSEGARAMYIRCEDLHAFRDLWFNPKTQRFYTPRQGDRVSFVVAFNYRGPFAVDVRRI